MLLCVIAVLLLVLNPVKCDFSDFLKNLSNEFTDAWQRLVDAIKQPVRIRRIGQTGKPKRTKPPTTTMRLFPSYTKLLATAPVRVTPMPLSKRVAIPLLRRPEFQTLGQWTQLQNPYISGLKAHEYMLRGGRGFGVMLERTVFPTPTPRYPTPSRVPVVPVLKLPTFRSLEQWGYLQLPRYVTMSPIRSDINVPTRVTYTLDPWDSVENQEITKPQRINHDYLSHTLLTENMIKMVKRKQNEKLISRLKNMFKEYTPMSM